jgi:hypothetical protein
MADESSAGASYLAGLKRTTPQATGAAAARAPDNTESAHSIENRRRSPRYRCQGSARLREIGSGTSTWATFTDISLHGCYVEAMSTFRSRARLELTMEVNGFRIECKAEVRVVYPNLGMGICFTSMSDADCQQLRELLQSLSRPSSILGVSSQAHSGLTSKSLEVPAVTNPTAALQAITTFFDERLILSREEFLRILRKAAK